MPSAWASDDREERVSRCLDGFWCFGVSFFLRLGVVGDARLFEAFEDR